METMIAITESRETAEQLIGIAYPKAVLYSENVYALDGNITANQIYIRDYNTVSDTNPSDPNEAYVVTTVYTDDPSTESMIMIAETREAAEREITTAFSRAENSRFIKIDDYTYSATLSYGNQKKSTVRIRIKKVSVLRSQNIHYSRPA